MRYFTVYHYLVWICAVCHPSCGEQSLSINAGTMLRECIKIRSIHQLLLSRLSLIEPLFTQYAFDPNFDVCSDVFQSIRDLLRKNKQIVSSALRPSKPLYNQLFSWIYALLESENYVITRIVLHVQIESNRLTFQLLGEFLIDKSNFEIMLHFIKSAENLKIFMILLCSQYPSIQFDAFNVFKVGLRSAFESDFRSESGQISGSSTNFSEQSASSCRVYRLPAS